ncbi:hypothetical protein NDN08_007776 [Rhodosorus marinus]|uniref:BZIP domain-containing protein n=1 Tax=Rhodosorus marinus TaxID=101924 RepID=A0AAV8UYI1_9RHOD|nr:hypothetical protein NDN08_007776 [Rhodosorus marinus]
MSDSSLLKCPHGESSEMYPLHDLITHLENCPSTCHEGGSGEAEVVEGANCDHLAKYEESVSKIWGDKKKCPHQSCSKALNNPQIVPRHLEECLEFCDSVEDGQCTHLNDFDAVLSDVFKMPVDGLKDNHTAPSSEMHKTEDRTQGFKGEISCPHDKCEEPLSSDLQGILEHLKSCDKSCTESKGTDCWHLSSVGVFCNDFSRANTATSEDIASNKLLAGQPPIFSPPGNASRSELKQLRQRHLQEVKKLTPEQRRERQILRNRRSARISKERRQEQIQRLTAENRELRRALSIIYSKYLTLSEQVERFGGADKMQ